MLGVTEIKQWVKYAAVAISAGALSVYAFSWSAPAIAQGTKSSLDVTVRALADKEQIHDLLIEYGHDRDTRDYVAYGKLFAKNGTWDGSLGLHKGPEEITAMLTHPTSGRTPVPFDPKNVTSFHLMTNIVIQVNGDRGTAQSKWTFFTRGPDKRPVATLSGHYDDTVIREDGRWKFLSRVALNDIP